MESRWDPAPRFDNPVAECVHGSRLLGSDPTLVLHGGGNTSIKTPWVDVTGEIVDAIFVKGSGWDLATIEEPGFAPLPLPRLRALLQLETLSDPDMMAALSAARLDPSAPQPSVETLLHALIPAPAVLHSHADVIVTLTNLADGGERVTGVLGDDVLVVPYVMPGFDLARAVAGLWPEVTDRTRGIVLLNHGLFTYGDTTRIAYERHVDLITAAEEWLSIHAPADVSPTPSLGRVDRVRLGELRRDLSAAAGRPMISTRHRDDQVGRFVSRDDLSSLAGRGPLTPDHVIRTKRVPMVGTDVAAYVDEYREYFDMHRSRARTAPIMLDPAPRVVLDPELGMVTAGTSSVEAGIVSDIYHHTMAVLERSEDYLGGYRALDPGDIFDCEYWDLEQAKLRRAGSPPPLTGQVAVVTGAASGIGRACAAELLARGAAVAGFDLASTVAATFAGPAWLGVTVDVTNGSGVDEALTAVVERFGGVDLVVAAAGIFGSPAPIAELDDEEWRRVQAINADSVLTLLRMVHPLLATSPASPAVVVVASKNVPAPGKGAAAYSASKAALTQLARIAALEWAEDGIRVNVVHPDAVFDTGLWNDELIAERADRYRMTPDEYKRRNLLSTEVTSATVAGVVAELLGPRFAATTGAQVPVDGGSDRVV